MKQENHFQRDSTYFWHRKLTLKIRFLQFLRGQNKLEVIGIKKLFDCKLFMGKNVYPVIWGALISTTVDTLLHTPLVVNQHFSSGRGRP